MRQKFWGDLLRCCAQEFDTKELFQDLLLYTPKVVWPNGILKSAGKGLTQEGQDSGLDCETAADLGAVPELLSPSFLFCREIWQ